MMPIVNCKLSSLKTLKCVSDHLKVIQAYHVRSGIYEEAKQGHGIRSTYSVAGVTICDSLNCDCTVSYCL